MRLLCDSPRILDLSLVLHCRGRGAKVSSTVGYIRRMQSAVAGSELAVSSIVQLAIFLHTQTYTHRRSPTQPVTGSQLAAERLVDGSGASQPSQRAALGLCQSTNSILEYLYYSSTTSTLCPEFIT